MINTERERLREGWHLDKRVPLTLIFAIVLQTFGALWWASSVNEKLEAAIANNNLQNQRIVDLQNRVSSNDVENARILERIDSLVTTVDRLGNELQRTNSILRDERRNR